MNLVDHILFARADVQLTVNCNEVAETVLVSKDDLRRLVDNRDVLGYVFTPWFDMIVQNFLFPWWNDLDSIMQGEVPNDGIIHRFGLYEAKCVEN